MKIGGYYRIGHIAIACKGMTEVIIPKYKRQMIRMLEHVGSLKPLDRLVSGQEFSDVTGLKVNRGNQKFIPKS